MAETRILTNGAIPTHGKLRVADVQYRFKLFKYDTARATYTIYKKNKYFGAVAIPTNPSNPWVEVWLPGTGVVCRMSGGCLDYDAGDFQVRLEYHSGELSRVYLAERGGVYRFDLTYDGDVYLAYRFEDAELSDTPYGEVVERHSWNYMVSSPVINEGWRTAGGEKADVPSPSVEPTIPREGESFELGYVAQILRRKIF